MILGSGPYEGHLRALIRALKLEDSVTIEYIHPGDRKRMAEILGEAAVVAALSEYEANPVAVMEALTIGTPAVGACTAGIADLVADGLVRGVPKDASPTTIARALISVMEGRRPKDSIELPTWESAANDLARVYLDAVAASQKSGRFK
jgi:glycosyltransferase involved in cell wall biosynthesis